MTDSDNVSVRSASPARPRGGRPAPLGPRLRQQSSFGNLLPLDGQASTSNRDSTLSTHSRESTSTLYSPPPSSPAFPPTSTGSPKNTLAVISESPVQSDPLQSVHSDDGHHEVTNSTLIAVPAPPPLTGVPTSTTTASPIPSRAPSPAAQPSPVHSSEPSLPPDPLPVTSSPVPSPRTRVVSKQATLLPPPQIKFESMQIQWKGLPLEAALWTFDSQELQNIVSRAIRSSAQESFIRLLSIKQLDDELPTELERLKNLKATTQAKYRFNAQRRTMLLQALMSYSETSGGGEKDGGGGGATAGRLASQLSETTIECDKLSQDLVGIMDQMGQIQRLLDVHWASALAIALRKLNGSYGKRTADLREARQRISHLEGELDDAWQEAEKMAQEIDDINALDSDSEDEDISRVVIQKAEVISVPQARPIYLSSPPLEPERSSLDQEILNDPLPPLPGSAVGPRFPISPTDDDDVISIRSKKSTKSYKSHKSLGGQSRVSVVSAARKRSTRTSMGSLRLPIRLFNPHGRENPPVPAIPKHLSPIGPPIPLSRDPSNSSSNSPSTSHPLNVLKSRNASDISIVDETLTPAQFKAVQDSPVVQSARRVSIDELDIEPSVVPQLPGSKYQLPPPTRAKPTSTMDDLYLPRKGSIEDGTSSIGKGSVGVIPGGSSMSGYGTGLAPVRRRRGSVDEQSIIANARRIGKDRQSQSIPSIWMNADATPATSHASRSSRVSSPIPNDHDPNGVDTTNGIPSGSGPTRVFTPEYKLSPGPNSSNTALSNTILEPLRFKSESDEEGVVFTTAGSPLSPSAARNTAIVSPISPSSSNDAAPSSFSPFAGAPSRSRLSRSNSKSTRDKLKTFSKRMSISGMFQMTGHGKGRDANDDVAGGTGRSSQSSSRNGAAPIEEGDDEGEDGREEDMDVAQDIGDWEKEMGYKARSSSRPSTSRSTPITGRSGSVAKMSMKSRGSTSTTSFLSLK
ncbi:hypothetical protein K435DRAFT_865976 [Dendrothele bispora CBS 962.96]|uniref:Uncharacterized protein n=1 Tax=Dendrothele bispora (strain CBS 962.96) TaxID=1314807 RepID=A0A4S8LI34_DENBC|nr:hypothetical protein K435DRAFT_865976 [Dendrothele bispora CBS 962.96]